jgi:gas vesicle protein
MARQDTNDFLTAFAIGAALGVGATLLLRPDKPNPRKQLQKRLKPQMRKLRKSAAKSRKAGGVAPRPAAAEGMEDDAIRAGRELLAEFRGEVQRILEEARGELRALNADRPSRDDGAGLEG